MIATLRTLLRPQEGSRTELGYHLPSHPSSPWPFALSAVGILVLLIALIEAVFDTPALKNNLVLFAPVLILAVAATITHRPGQPMYTLPVPVAAACTIVYAWDSYGWVVLTAALCVATATSVRAVILRDRYSAIVPPALAALSASLLCLLTWLVSVIAGSESTNSPAYVIVFGALAVAFSLLDVKVGALLRSWSNVGRPAPVRWTAYASHFANSAATAGPAALVTWLAYDVDVLTLIGPVMFGTALAVVVALRGLPGTNRDRFASDLAAGSYASALIAMSDARTVGQLQRIVAEYFPELFGAFSAHVATLSEPFDDAGQDARDHGYSLVPLTDGPTPVGTLVLLGPDPYAPRTLQAPALEALSRALVSVAEDEDMLRRQEDSERQVQSLTASIEHDHKLFASAQHEIGNPLAIIDGYLGLLRMNVFTADQMTEPLDAIQSASKRIRLVSQSLLTLAAAERGMLEPSREPASLTQLVTTMGLEYKQMFPERIIRVLCPSVAEGAAPVVYLDPLWFRQVVDNLVSNAVKASRVEQVIDVTLSVEGEDFVVRVRDRGVGISPEDLARVQEAFYRAEDGKRRKVAGTGLGLYIVSGLMDLHGGTFAIDSTLGEGTTSTVCFTAATRPPASQRPAAE